MRSTFARGRSVCFSLVPARIRPPRMRCPMMGTQRARWSSTSGPSMGAFEVPASSCSTLLVPFRTSRGRGASAEIFRHSGGKLPALRSQTAPLKTTVPLSPSCAAGSSQIPMRSMDGSIANSSMAMRIHVSRPAPALAARKTPPAAISCGVFFARLCENMPGPPWPTQGSAMHWPDQTSEEGILLKKQGN